MLRALSTPSKTKNDFQLLAVLPDLADFLFRKIKLSLENYQQQFPFTLFMQYLSFYKSKQQLKLSGVNSKCLNKKSSSLQQWKPRAQRTLPSLHTYFQSRTRCTWPYSRGYLKLKLQSWFRFLLIIVYLSFFPFFIINLEKI